MPYDYAALFNNPLFLGGVAALSGQKGQEGQNLIRGMGQGSQLQSAEQLRQLQAMKIAQAQAQQNFNPADYMGTTPTQGTALPELAGQMAQQPSMPAALGGVGGGSTPMMQPGAQQPVSFQPGTPNGQIDYQGMLQGGLKAGFGPAELAGMASFMDPTAAARAKMAEPYTLGAGQQRMVGNQVIGSNTNQPPNQTVQAIMQLTQQRDAARQAGNNEMADTLQSTIDKVSGKFDQESRLTSQANLELNRQRLDVDRDASRAAAAGARENAQVQKIQGQATQFSNQLQKIGLPAAKQQLDTIDSIMDKYKDQKSLPGYGMIDSLKPSWALPQEGQELRQAVQSFANVLLKTRSGAAVTEPEQKRFLEEMGTGGFMPVERVKQGIKMMKGLMDAEMRNAGAGVSNEVIDAYEGSGGALDFSQYRSKDKPALSNRNSPSIDQATPDDIAAELARRRGKK